MAKRKKPKNRKRREWTPPSALKATKTPGSDNREKAIDHRARGKGEAIAMGKLWTGIDFKAPQSVGEG